MQHVRPISIERPARADTLTTLAAFIDLLTAIVALAGEISSVFGINAFLNKMTDATS
jgi:hypothetical protein